MYSNNRNFVTNYVLFLDINNTDFKIKNCLIQNNIKFGVIGVIMRFTNTDGNKGQIGHILNNEFADNRAGASIVNVSRHIDLDTSADWENHYVHIEGNSFIRNSPNDSHSAVYVNDVYCNISSNVFFNNECGRVLNIQQGNLPTWEQKCTNNLIYYNKGNLPNERFTIETQANGLLFHNNVIYNPVNDYEINALTGDFSQPVNASNNWWGTTSVARIKERLRGSHIVIGFADVVYQPFLMKPPQDVHNCKYHLYGFN